MAKQNNWDYSSYYQSPIELNDIYGPAICKLIDPKYPKLERDYFCVKRKYGKFLEVCIDWWIMESPTFVSYTTEILRYER